MPINFPGQAINTNPTGLETAIVSRGIFRKQQILLTATPLAANGVFTSPWFDTQLDGTGYVSIYTVANQVNLATTGTSLQESDDQVAANVRNVAIQGAIAVTRVAGPIRQRYWRCVYSNGGTALANLQVYAVVSGIPFGTSPLVNGAVAEYSTISSGTGAANVLADNVGNQSGAQITNQAGTGSVQVVDGILYNGSTWDRPRANYNTTTGDTGAKAATFNGATQTNFDSAGAYITVILGTVSGSTPTLAAQLQWSPDVGTTFLNLGPATSTVNATGNTILIACYPTAFAQSPGATPANLTTGATVSTFIQAPLPRTWRLAYTITGSTPSFAITTVTVNYQKN